MKPFLFAVLALVVIFSHVPQGALADEAILSQTTQAGQPAVYTLELHNETTSEHVYRLMLAGLPESMTVTFTGSGPVMESVSIAANSYGQITLHVGVPAETTVGHYTATLTATRDDNTALTLPIALNVENTYAVQITSQNVNINTFSGQEFTFEVAASNTGASPVTNLGLVVTTPARWVAQVEPNIVNQLDPGSSVTFAVRVLVPATQAAIEQNLTMMVTSDEITSAETSLPVRVQTSPNFFLYAGLVSLAALVGVFVYFRVKGRR